MVSRRIKLSIGEQIEKKEKSIKQLQNQKRQLKEKLNEQERKARNKRLIEKGTVFKSIFEESVDFTKDEFYQLITFPNIKEEVNQKILKIIEKRKENQNQNTENQEEETDIEE